jgi:hypothetical protein
MTVFIKDALATAKNEYKYRSQKRIKPERTGAELFENDGERRCRYALVRKVWVVPGNCGEDE